VQLRQKLSSAQVAKRANIGRSTLLNIENGKAGINIGYYLLVLQVLGLESDFFFCKSIIGKTGRTSLSNGLYLFSTQIYVPVRLQI